MRIHNLYTAGSEIKLSYRETFKKALQSSKEKSKTGNILFTVMKLVCVYTETTVSNVVDAICLVVIA